MPDIISETTGDFIAKFEDRIWGFVYVKSRTEKKLLEKLLTRNIPCYLPLNKKMRIHHRGKVFTEIPMFPSYVFLCPDNTEIPDIKRQNEVVTVNIVPPPLEDDFIRELNLVRKFELFSQDRITFVNPEIQSGETVMVKNGPLKNNKVVVIPRADEVSVIVNLRFLRRSCECKISIEESKLLI